MTSSGRTDHKSVHIPPGDLGREIYRLSTYLKFPAISPVDLVALARHGFYYTGYKDRVKCFSCGSFVQDWNPQDNPRLARWHLQGCKLVLGTETANVPIGNHSLEFVGTFTSSLSNSESGDSSISDSSSDNPLPLFPSYLSSLTTRSAHFSNTFRASPAANSHGGTHNISISNRSSPNMSNLTTAVDDIDIDRTNSLLNTRNVASNPRQQTAHVLKSSNENRVKVQGLDLASVVSSSHRLLLLQQLDLHKEEDRRKSYASWKCPAVTPEDLAKSGFFYLGNLDRCQCFSCSGVLRNWRYGDCVEDEHRRHFGDCKMVWGREHRNIPLNGVALTLNEPADSSPEEKLRLEREFPCLHPVNPHMKNYEARLQTFDQRWPSYKVLATKEHIAKAGFFFLGERDRAKCWYCNGGLQNWDPNDEPFTEHAKWFPGCEYMLRCKGVDFVRNIVQQFPNLKRSTLRRPRFDHRTKQLINSTPALPTQIPIYDPRNTMSAGALLMSYNPSPSDAPSSMITETPSLPNAEDAFQKVDLSEHVKCAEEVGIAKEMIQRGVQMITSSGKEIQGANDFVSFLMEQQPQPVSQVSSETFVFQGSTNGERNAHPEASEKRSKCMEVDEQTLTNEGRDGKTPSEMSKTGKTANWSKELEVLENERKCKTCFQRQADTVIIPCGHLSLCSVCSPAARKCGVCRTKIVNTIKVFLS